jgi:flagellar motor switch protein FliM
MSRVLTPQEIEALRAAEPYIPAPRERYHVVVEAGHAELTPGEIAALQPGDFVTLDRATSQPVEIVANAVMVARGYLTERHGRVAVRIVSLEGPRK